MKIGQIFKLIISVLSLVADMLEDNEKEKENEKTKKEFAE